MRSVRSFIFHALPHNGPEMDLNGQIRLDITFFTRFQVLFFINS